MFVYYTRYCIIYENTSYINQLGKMLRAFCLTARGSRCYARARGAHRLTAAIRNPSRIVIQFFQDPA